MPGLAELLQSGGQGGPPRSPGNGPMPPDQGGGSPDQNGMPVQQAIQVMQKFGIGPQDLPVVAQAIMALIQAGALGGGEAGEQPPGPGGPPMA